MFTFVAGVVDEDGDLAEVAGFEFFCGEVADDGSVHGRREEIVGEPVLAFLVRVAVDGEGSLE